MQFRLRTLLIVLAVGPAFLAGAWWGWLALQPKKTDWEELVELLDSIEDTSPDTELNIVIDP